MSESGTHDTERDEDVRERLRYEAEMHLEMDPDDRLAQDMLNVVTNCECPRSFFEGHS